MIQKEAFAEWAEIYGHFYGTPLKSIAQTRERGDDVLFDIDCRGARQIREKFPKSVFIFVLPPSTAILEKRLRSRNTDASGVIIKRLDKARQEISQATEYDYLIVNDIFNEALQVLRSIVISEKHRCEFMLEKLSFLKN